MKEKLVTFESVSAAAEALAATGGRVSGRAIIKSLGGGSPNDIHEFLRQWQASRPVVKAAEIQVDPKIGQLIADQVSRAVAESRTEVDARLLEVEADAHDLATTGRELEKQVLDLTGRLEASMSHAQTLTGRIAQLEADAETLKAETVAAVRAANEKAEKEVQAREAVNLAKAHLRLESLPRLEAENSGLRDSLESERAKRTDAERNQAMAEAKAGGLADRLADAQQQVQRAISLHQKTESELGEVRKALAAKTELVGSQAGIIATIQQQIADARKKVIPKSSTKPTKNERGMQP